MKLPKPKISTRMQLFVDKSVNGMPFWDFCCDHGYIGISALYSERFSEVHFVDQIPHIIDRLEKLILQSPSLKKDYQFYFYRSGGENIDIEVKGTVLIAGVSGRTIKNILESLISKNILRAHRILLSPHLDIGLLEDFCEQELPKFHYKKTDFIEIQENSRIRPLYIYDFFDE